MKNLNWKKKRIKAIFNSIKKGKKIAEQTRGNFPSPTQTNFGPQKKKEENKCQRASGAKNKNQFINFNHRLHTYELNKKD